MERIPSRGIITPVPGWNRTVSCKFPTACANTSAVMTILPGIWRRQAMWFAATTIWDTAPQAAARTEQTAILPKRTDANLHEMNRLAREAYPGLPVILLGHSMGSFFARMYAVLYPETLHALVLSGTGGPNPLAGVGLALTEAIGRVKGRKHRSKFLNNMAFGQYLKRVDSPDTPYDWISRDKEVVARYAQDAKCTFIFTASAFHELMAILRAVNRPQWAQKVDKRLPVALFAGDADPVGDYGRGVESVYRALKDAGVKDVFLKLYPGARHEILNETNRAEVYADILAWCDAHQA